jgi:hypothetical protein
MNRMARFFMAISWRELDYGAVPGTLPSAHAAIARRTRPLE